MQQHLLVIVQVLDAYVVIQHSRLPLGEAVDQSARARLHSVSFMAQLSL